MKAGPFSVIISDGREKVAITCFTNICALVSALRSGTGISIGHDVSESTMMNIAVFPAAVLRVSGLKSNDHLSPGHYRHRM